MSVRARYLDFYRALLARYPLRSGLLVLCFFASSVLDALALMMLVPLIAAFSGGDGGGKAKIGAIVSEFLARRRYGTASRICALRGSRSQSSKPVNCERTMKRLRHRTSGQRVGLSPAQADIAEPADIILITPHMGLGGAQRVLANLANAWVSEGLSIWLVKIEHSVPDFYPLDPRIRVEVVQLPDKELRSRLLRLVVKPVAYLLGFARRRVCSAIRFASWLRRVIRLRRLIKASQAPVVVSFLTNTNILTISASFGLRRRIIISERNDPSRQVIDPHRANLRRLLYRRADVITSNSHGVLEMLKTIVPAQKLALVPNPVILSPRSVSEETRVFAILAVGRLKWQKGFDVLIRAFALIAEKYPEWGLDVVGDGEERSRLWEIAEFANVARRIQWHGLQADPQPFYERASIFALPSRFEGMPNVLLEAMTCGLPTVITDASPGPLEAVEHGVSGLVVSSEDPAAMAAALSHLISDMSLRRRMGREAKARAANWRINEVLPIWDEVLGLKARA